MSENKSRWIDCVCSTPEHSIRFEHGYEDGEVYVTTCLRPGLGFFARLKAAFWYVIGNRQAVFEDTILSQEKVEDLICFLDQDEPFEFLKKDLDRIF